MLYAIVFGVVIEFRDFEDVALVCDHFTLSSEATRSARADSALADQSTSCRSAFRHVAFPPTRRLAKWGLIERLKQRNRGAIIGFSEFVDLNDDRRFCIRSDRGFGWISKHNSAWRGVTRESLADDVRDAIAQYEEKDPTSPKWFVERLKRLYGVEVDLESVSAALRSPLRIEFGNLILRRVGTTPNSGAPGTHPAIGG